MHYQKRRRAALTPARARGLLLKHGRRVPRERAQRMRQSAIAHLSLARLSQQQARTQRTLASQIRREAVTHVQLTQRAAEGASRQTLRGARRMKNWGAQHLLQSVIGNQEVHAHLRLAQRSAARSQWHRTIASLLWRASRL